MKSARHPGRSAGRERGAALIITIFMLVLLTVASVAFFTRATANRSIENSRANKVLADQLARSGADYAAGLLLEEIAAGSTNITTNNGIVVYLPRAASNAVAQRVLAAGVGASDTNFANLLRQTTNGTHNTAAPAQNGRAVGAARWNAPFLLGGGGFTATNQLPAWIYVNRDGTATAAPTTNAVGRFACNVYDIGGLLDANVAGYPASVAAGSSNRAILKGSVAGAELSMIPGVSSADAFVRWRNTNTASSASGYVTAVTNAATNGFLRPAPDDHRLQSRQDLITAARNGTGGLSTNALPFLTTFSRALDAPSHSPAAGRPKVLPDRNLATVGQDDAFNPSLVGTRVTRAFTRADGRPAKPGEPLLASRFPLERLSLVAAAPGAVNDASDLYSFFGLTRSGASAPWVYNHGDAGRILRLDEVAAAGREPDFFELLQAAVSVGSLTQAGGENYSNRYLADFDKNLYYHVIQLGANLLDQYDTDSYPARIEFNGVEFSGIEDLPYLSRVWDKYFRSSANTNVIGLWLRPEVWNPHRQTPNTARPTVFRFVAEGAASFSVGHAAPVTGAPTRTYSPIRNFFSADPGITFSLNANNRGFRTPEFLKPGSGGATATGTDNVTGAVPFVGLHMGTIPAPFAQTSGIGYGGWWFSQPEISFYLQYRDPSGNWVTYDRFEDIVQGCGSGPGNSGPDVDWNVLTLLKADARSQRFGAAVTWEGAPGEQKATDNQPRTTPRRHFGRPGWRLVGKDRGAPGITLPFGEGYPGWSWVRVGGEYHLGGMDDNNTNAPSVRYADPDDVIRAADAAYASGSWGRMLDMNSNGTGTNSRPIVLNRPFRSVAEMGYAFRDVPYRSIDFFTARSGDGALLDAFSVGGNSAPLVAGKVNLNTRRPEVLAAVIAGAQADELTGTTSLTATNALAAANRLTAVTAINPLSGMAGIATNLMPALVAADLGPTENAAVKYRRESVARALAAAGDTRTWNVLVDVVAQSGKFAGGATGASNFVVEGESRLWASMAIDRYLGRPIAGQTEVINE